MNIYARIAALVLALMLGAWVVNSALSPKIKALESDLQLATARVQALELARTAAERANTHREAGRNTNARVHYEKRTQLESALQHPDNLGWANAPMPADVVRVLTAPATGGAGAARSPPVHANP